MGGGWGGGGRDVYRGVVCAVVAGSLWAGVGGAVIVALRAGLGVCGLSMWRVGRERGEAERDTLPWSCPPLPL